MAIRGPKGAVPTTRGWVHPLTNELLKVQKISQQQIDEWHDVPAEVTQHEEHVIQTLHEAPHVEVEVEKPTYNYFSTFARQAPSSEE